MFKYVVEFWDEIEEKVANSTGLCAATSYADACNRLLAYFGEENISSIQLEEYFDVMEIDDVKDAIINE